MSEARLDGWDIVLAGGDAREEILARELEKKGARVSLVGFDNYNFATGERAKVGLPERADAIICPLAGIDTTGCIYAPFAAGELNLAVFLTLLRKGLLFLCGRLPEEQQEFLEQRGVRVAITADMDEIAIYNAVPTAEGAVEIAMRESTITIHGSKVLVIGSGRCGLPLAKTLQGMGAEVTVAARRREALAMARALGFFGLAVTELESAAGSFDFIFNTVPALVLHSDVIRRVRTGAVIVDIASPPGGTDFESARKRGIKGFLAPGLPGKVAPVTAGRILAGVYPHILLERGKGEEK